MRYNIIFAILATIFVSTATAQNTGLLHPIESSKNDPASKLPFAKKLKLAESMYRAASYSTAEKYFGQLKREQPRNPYVTAMLAEVALKQRDYPVAAKYYREAYELSSDLYPTFPYFEALMLKSNAQYHEAKERLQFFIANYKGKDKKMKVYAKRQLDGCDKALASLANPSPAFIKSAGPNVNTAYTESAPVPLGDTALMFATQKSNSLIDISKIERKDYVSRFMWSPKEFDRTKIKDSFEVAMPFTEGPFNDPRLHVSSGNWSPGGSRFYFTTCDEDEKDSNRVKCRIWVSEFDTLRGVFGQPKSPDEFINDRTASNQHPFCARIGKKEVLFFSSNRKGQSAGGFDLWYSVYDAKNKTYRRPQNCGKKINSNRDEITPWYDANKGKLYFSSDGWENFGGFDVYTADGGPSRYTNLRILEFPINSPADDFSYIEDPDKKGNAYVVSNRLGSIYVKNPTCCDDIWRVIKQPNFWVKGNVIDEETGQTLSEVVVRLNDDGANKFIDTFYSGKGDYRFYTPMGKTYTVYADKKGYVSGFSNLSTLEKKVWEPDDTVSVDIYMKKEQMNADILTVGNVYYDFNKKEFQPDSYKRLDSLVSIMVANPSISVDIISHADAIGEDEDNVALSLRRAEQVKNYLANKGIDPARLNPVPVGEKDPVRPDKNPDGSDNPENRAWNRRTQFRINGYIPGKRIEYENNRPEYIDKSGVSTREERMRIDTGPDDGKEEPTFEETPPEAVPGNVIRK